MFFRSYIFLKKVALRVHFFTLVTIWLADATVVEQKVNLFGTIDNLKLELDPAQSGRNSDVSP